MIQLIQNNIYSFRTHMLAGFFLPLAIVVFAMGAGQVGQALWIVPVTTTLALILWHHEVTHGRINASA